MYPPEIIEALKDALRAIYWYKRQLRSFLENCRVPPEVVNKQRWDDPEEYKIRIIEKVVSELDRREEGGLGPIRELIRRVIDMSDFSHLQHLEDGRKKVAEAKVLVERLRQLVSKHDEKVRLEEERRCKRAKAAEERVRKLSHFGELDKLNKDFLTLVSQDNHQARGTAFERFLYKIFDTFDLVPRGSFLIVGEQIDGAFELDGNQYLIEAKWEQHPVGAREIRILKEQVESKLDNTLGLFVSLNGFTDDGITAVQRTRPNVILMDGGDITAVLEGLLDLRELLRRKIRHAAQTGSIFLQAKDILGK